MEKVFNIGLDQKDVNIILIALGDMPYVKSVGVINRIAEQIAPAETTDPNKKEG